MLPLAVGWTSSVGIVVCYCDACHIRDADARHSWKSRNILLQADGRVLW